MGRARMTAIVTTAIVTTAIPSQTPTRIQRRKLPNAVTHLTTVIVSEISGSIEELKECF